ncbi:MAG: DNA mismatch repair protein MutS [Vicinamibacterales bacterium]
MPPTDPSVPSDPLREYQQRLAQRHATHAALDAEDLRLARLRLLVFGAGAILAALAWGGTLSPWWLAGPVVAFAALAVRHDRVLRARTAAARAIRYYERGLARLEDRWAGTGEAGARFVDDAHLFANDLDLFGHGSLFELLSIARTQAGEAMLAAWLVTPAGPAEIRARQVATDELRDRHDLREALALAGTELRSVLNAESLVAWAEGAPVLRHAWTRAAAVVLTALAIGTGALWLATGDATPFFIVLALEVLLFVPMRVAIQHALHAAEGPARDLDVLAHALRLLEAERFQSPLLSSLRATLETASVPASVVIGRMQRLVELHAWQHNQFFGPIGAVVLWGTHLAWAIERWRSAHGASVRHWLKTVAEFEALQSLAAYRYEHPADSLPVILDTAEGPVLEGVDLGHPLIPEARSVRNSVRLGGAHPDEGPHLLVVSGSNMSGKSTLLRTVGVNVVLAFAGAPVRAASLRLTPLALGATLRVQDSLQDGRSRFYAEIARLRQLADVALQQPPLLFLLDELFHGTNSHDRAVGAAGVLRSLLARGAIGFVTTHDLALTAVATELAPRAANVHFEDRLEDGDIVFDYRMKPGPVTHSNAIALMRAVGLDVPGA